MDTITPSEAVSAVRKNLDEQEINASAMYNTGSPDTTDNDALDSIIVKTLPDAINWVHGEAPLALLEGVAGTPASASFSNNSLVFSFTTKTILRLVAFQAVDSNVVVGEWTPEYSPEGRQQLNEYVRGTYDDPVLVKVHGKQQFRYYTVKSATATTYASAPEDAIARFDYVPLAEYADNAVSYQVSPLLKESALLHLTGMVLAIYGGSDKANYFFEKAKIG